MALVMKTHTRGVVRFEWTDDEAETTVSIEHTDSDEVMLKKLKRVIALVEGEQGRPVVAYFDPPPPVLHDPVVVAQTGNGWAAYAPPEVPEHLQGEVELIPSGEDA